VARPARCNARGMAEPLIAREEIAAALFALHDILDEIRAIRRNLEGDDGGELEEGLGE
jgi:hypothetical protein